jgi:hypothetical protein
MSIIILLSWSIWISRNDLGRQGLQPTVDSCRSIFKKKLVLLVHPVKAKHKAFLEARIDNFG